MEIKLVEHTVQPKAEKYSSHRVLLDITLEPSERLEAIQVRHPEFRTEAPMVWFQDPKYAEVKEPGEEMVEKLYLTTTSWTMGLYGIDDRPDFTDEPYDDVHVVARVRRGDLEIVNEGHGLLYDRQTQEAWSSWGPNRITVRTSTCRWVGEQA